MLTDEELRKFFHAVDALEPTARSPLRHLIMPEVFRLLYGCGFRVREVLKLRVRDVDLNQGIITVRQGKFRKDRLVPPALSLVNRLRKYAGHFEKRQEESLALLSLGDPHHEESEPFSNDPVMPALKFEATWSFGRAGLCRLERRFRSVQTRCP